MVTDVWVTLGSHPSSLGPGFSSAKRDGELVFAGLLHGSKKGLEERALHSHGELHSYPITVLT